jgi:transcriptional regulator with XRE-family HTH domain
MAQNVIMQVMDQLNKQEVAGLVKEGRIAKGYTQQELADLTKLSLRSVQRIENAEVVPRLYTLRVLAQHLNFSLERPAREIEPTIVGQNTLSKKTPRLSKARKLILTFGSGILLLLLTGAFLSQSARFPETDFERFLLWSFVVGAYSVVLFRIWK